MAHRSAQPRKKSFVPKMRSSVVAVLATLAVLALSVNAVYVSTQAFSVRDALEGQKHITSQFLFALNFPQLFATLLQHATGLYASTIDCNEIFYLFRPFLTSEKAIEVLTLILMYHSVHVPSCLFFPRQRVQW